MLTVQQKSREKDRGDSETLSLFRRASVESVRSGGRDR
jgi:hypothetical protein